jgi:hypothetical protein
MRICIDPGHSYVDPGIVGVTGIKEVDVTLHFALLLKQYLNTQGHEVILTRADEHVTAASPAQDLKQRSSMARYTRCQAFVSIHGAYTGNDLDGIAIYYPQGEGLSAQLAVQVYQQLHDKPMLERQSVMASSENGLLKRVGMPAIEIVLAMFGDQRQEDLLQDTSWLNATTQTCGEAIVAWQTKYWQRLAIGESEVVAPTQIESAIDTEDPKEQGDEASIASSDTDIDEATTADAEQIIPDVQELTEEAKGNQVRPIAVQARIVDGMAVNKQISEEAQERLESLSETAMERMSRLSSVTPKQTSSSGITTRVTVSKAKDNAIPKPKPKVAKRTDAEEDASVKTNMQSGNAGAMRSGVAIPVPVVHSHAKHSGARTPFRASAVVQTSRGRTPMPVQVTAPAKGKAADKGSPS